MLEPTRAWQILDGALAPLRETVPRRKALGRVLAQGLAATVDVPFASVSAMDGFALGGEVEPGSELPVAFSVAAGHPAARSLPPGAAARIMTGAAMPSGADRVVPVEATRPGAEEGTVRFAARAAAGAHVRRQGEVHRVGDELLPAGSLLTPGALALLASHGIAEVEAWAAPRVAVLPTGDEVVAPETSPGPGQLRDSHTDFLLAAGATLGLAFTPLGIARDDPADLRRHLAAGAESHDVLLLGGGVSMGEHDHVEAVAAELGFRALFDAVAIQPGKPLFAAVGPGGRPLLLGLPGNPASVMVTFWLFVRPALRRLLGLADGFWHGALAARLDGPLPGAKGRDRFLPATVRFAEDGIVATPVAPRGSHDVAAYGRGTALVRVPAGARERGPGEACSVLPLAHWPEERAQPSR